MSASSLGNKPRILWRDDETRILLKSWRNHIHINKLIKKGCSKHPLYYAISKDLQKYGFNRSINEIMFKTKNLMRYKTKQPGAALKFANQIDEILDLYAGRAAENNSTAKNNQSTEPQTVFTTEQPQIVLNGSFVEGIDSENVQVIRLSVPDHQDVPNSSSSSYTVIGHLGSEIQNENEVIEVSMPQTSSSNSQNTSENILLSFFQEFERSNRQLEKNDEAMLELFKEQNDIFRTQTTLLMKLLLK